MIIKFNKYFKSNLKINEDFNGRFGDENYKFVFKEKIGNEEYSFNLSDVHVFFYNQSPHLPYYHIKKQVNEWFSQFIGKKICFLENFHFYSGHGPVNEEFCIILKDFDFSHFLFVYDENGSEYGLCSNHEQFIDGNGQVVIRKPIITVNSKRSLKMVVPIDNQGRNIRQVFNDEDPYGEEEWDFDDKSGIEWVNRVKDDDDFF